MTRLLAPPLVIVTLLAGTWFWGSVVAPGYFSAIGLVIAWFVLCSVLFGRMGKARPDLRPWLRGTFLACCALSLAAFYWTSIRDTVVDEDLPVAVPASRAATPDRPRGATAYAPVNVVERAGPVRPASHSASGTARVVSLASGGRRLTLSDGFEIDPGPQVRVYLATDESANTHEDLGKLKGSKGDQQYRIPPGLDLGTHDTVVLWCVPFTVALATARLRPA